jgi:hypothetical protein
LQWIFHKGKLCKIFRMIQEGLFRGKVVI